MMTRILLLLFVCSTMSCAAALDEERVDDVLALEGDPQTGAAFFSDSCERCHGPDGNGDGQGPELVGAGLQRRDIVEAVLKGPWRMPSFSDESDQELADVTAFVDTL